VRSFKLAIWIIALYTNSFFSIQLYIVHNILQAAKYSMSILIKLNDTIYCVNLHIRILNMLYDWMHQFEDQKREVIHIASNC